VYDAKPDWGPIWIDREKNHVFSGKQTYDFWADVFRTGRTPDGRLMLSEGLNLVEMSGFDDVTEDDVWRVSAIGFQVVVRLIPMSAQLNDIGHLITMCTRSKFGGPPFGEASG
jgi:hypothetical protein